MYRHLRLHSALLISLLFIINSSTGAQTLVSGIVNDYTKVTAIIADQLSVTSSAGFAAGDKVLVIQMKGATIDNTASPSYGDITAYGSAGLYEFQVVESVAPGTLDLSSALCNIYDVTGCVQVVRVPVYSDAEVVAPGITCQPWNGTTGGIVAIETTGGLTLSANIDVSGRGFRGGNFCSSSFSCSDPAWFSSSGGACSGGAKGEGIADFIMGEEGSRGKLANGGGGANRGNCGGGGGSNYGQGGLGGRFYSGCSFPGIQGIGGAPLDYSNDRAYLGGGGGGGYRDNGQPTTNGGDGAGIVILQCNSLDGGGQQILANGNDVVGITNDEGAGGGGGGGSIILHLTTMSGPLDLRANGGRGGDTENFIFTSNCHGPGGGAGGGYIATTLPIWAASVTTEVEGGTNGNVLHNTTVCGPAPTPHGATSGADGGVVLGLISDPGGPTVDLGSDQSICDGLTFTFDAGTGFDSYLWNDGSDAQTLDAATSGTYFVEVETDCGIAYDTVELEVFPLPLIDLGDDISFCLGDSVVFDGGLMNPGDIRIWSDGSADQTLTAFNAGQYWLQVTDANGCLGGDTVEVSEVFALPIVELGPDVEVCPGETALFDASTDFDSYLWNSGQISSVIEVGDTATYLVIVTDDNGCVGEDSVHLGFLPLDSCESALAIPNAFTPNGDGLNDEFRAISIGAELISFQMMIFNRWGEKVFLTSDINAGWDATFRGVPVEAGSYVYLIEMEALREGRTVPLTRTGTITVLR